MKGEKAKPRILKYASEWARDDVYAQTNKDGKLSIRKEFGTYNFRRYGAPWGAVVSLVGGRLNMDFCGYYTGTRDGYTEGDVYVTCEAGVAVVAFGQKDNRGNGSRVDYYVVDNSAGRVEKVTRDEAYKLLQSIVKT